ncbi:unnamed protein product, partial [Closterium sp. NIES-54]
AKVLCSVTGGELAGGGRAAGSGRELSGLCQWQRPHTRVRECCAALRFLSSALPQRSHLPSPASLTRVAALHLPPSLVSRPFTCSPIPSQIPFFPPRSLPHKSLHGALLVLRYGSCLLSAIAAAGLLALPRGLMPPFSFQPSQMLSHSPPSPLLAPPVTAWCPPRPGLWRMPPLCPQHSLLSATLNPPSESYALSSPLPSFPHCPTSHCVVPSSSCTMAHHASSLPSVLPLIKLCYLLTPTLPSSPRFPTSPCGEPSSPWAKAHACSLPLALSLPLSPSSLPSFLHQSLRGALLAMGYGSCLLSAFAAAGLLALARDLSSQEGGEGK